MNKNSRDTTINLDPETQKAWKSSTFYRISQNVQQTEQFSESLHVVSPTNKKAVNNKADISKTDYEELSPSQQHIIRLLYALYASKIFQERHVAILESDYFVLEDRGYIIVPRNVILASFLTEKGIKMYERFLIVLQNRRARYER